MTGVLIEPSGSYRCLELSDPLHKSLHTAVDGHFEIVHARELPWPYVMICNEEFLYLDLPLNPLASFLYGTHLHGHPILGNVVILKEQYLDLVGLDMADLFYLDILFPRVVSHCLLLQDPRDEKDRQGEKLWTS